ncbi:anoctamin-2-like isoform X2 [Diorhabda carinulata]|uniref:anoctamin-2-like isoform X2 n=1 Tax=Diorhabda carinulata TaxID=1163345 RepID=UPI0025A27129|nr:anoctamin-2-like isoform X2 [Diorhabda carinulata]
MEDDDDFFDTVSVNSTTGKRRFNSKEYLGLSRNTVYRSIMDFDDANELEMGDLDQKKVPNKSRVVNTYEQWKNRRWRYFSSCDLSVDYVLAYEDQGDTRDVEKRTNYEHNLESNGLILEREENQRIHFVKIHVPKDVIMRYAEILKLRLPIKDDEESPQIKENIVTQTVVKILNKCKVSLDPDKFPPKKYQLTAEFNKDKDYLFDVDDPEFFNSSVKITVISYILERERFGNEDQDKGIKRLIAENVYKAAYPLHDGDLHDKTSTRKLLLDEWASVSKCIKFQPLDEIKDYFGVKCAIYFAWLGFYTHMLIPASIVGILCLLYGAITLHSDILSRDICNAKNITMCPRCDKYCDYWYIQESCNYSKIQHIIDNNATIFFAVFMSFWGTFYLEMWKRYSAEIAHRWGLTGFDLQAEPPRPEYLLKLANAKKKKLNVITQLQEPVVPFWRVKLPSLIISFSVAFCWTLIALAVVVAVVVYRMSSLTSGYLHSGSSYKIYAIPVTAGLINLTCIHILNFLYGRLAETLTELELQRTQNEFDESLAIKIYMFQFVNFYSSIFYIAFIKGKYVGYPAKYNRILGYRQEECNPGGCLMELTIQLAIIMIGNQAINAVMEMSVPVAMKMYKTFIVTTGIDKADKEETALISCNQWTEDYKLSEIESKSLYSEYLEMVLQYGFVTIFVTAFPLAPLFALINNILEMRLDAKKFLKYYRRPVPQRVKNIGVWYSILAFVGRLAVVSNAFIIAFSSHFIPKLVYKLKYSHNFTEEGYMEHSLAFFNTSHFAPNTAPIHSQINATVCRYPEYRNHYSMDDHTRYKRPLIYWHILAARLAFVVVYQNLVSFVMTAVEWMIPDVSRKLNDRIKREAYRTNEIIIHNETRRARERKASSSDSQNLPQTNFDAATGLAHVDLKPHVV